MAQAAKKYSLPPELPADKLTSMVMRLFQHWKLTYEEQANLLGLSPKTRSTIARYKNGTACIVLERDTRDRVGFLLSIHQHLKTIFPLNDTLAYAWPKMKNKAFEGRSPVETMMEEGFLGVVKVQRYLENYNAN